MNFSQTKHIDNNQIKFLLLLFFFCESEWNCFWIMQKRTKQTM